MPLHVRYFVNAAGNILLPPTDDIPCPPSYELREANTLPEIDELQRRLEAAKRRELEAQAIRDEFTFMQERHRIYDSLNTKLNSSSTSPYEKDFIREYLKLRYEKRQEYQKRFLCDQSYFEMREFDHKRTPAEVIGEDV